MEECLVDIQLPVIANYEVAEVFRRRRPFFADAKLSSMNASLQSSCPLRFNSPKNMCQIVN